MQFSHIDDKDKVVAWLSYQHTNIMQTDPHDTNHLYFITHIIARWGKEETPDKTVIELINKRLPNEADDLRAINLYNFN
jgi:hypothetical protein